MASIGKPGGATRLGRFLGSVLLAAVAVGIAYWYVNRPKAVPPQVVAPATQVEAPQSTQVEAPPVVRAEPPQAQPAAPQPTPQQPKTSGGSDDPYGNLSTKEKK